MPPQEHQLMTDSQQQVIESSSRPPPLNDEEACCRFHNIRVKSRDNDDEDPSKPSNEYVLNFAFFSFVGFMAVQIVFAIIANSQSMLADSEAMSVDALTYLFNLLAERIKKRPLSEDEQNMAPEVCRYYRELRRLYLELIPPAVSVFTLICVTVITLREAISTLRGMDDDSDEDDVSVRLMLIFSSANLLLDFVNVSCFARANSSFGWDMLRRERKTISDSLRDINGLMDQIQNEQSPLMGEKVECKRQRPRYMLSDDDEEQEDDTESSTIPSPFGMGSTIRPCEETKPNSVLNNLNMCSAWTHICADTLRSLAVVLAAGIATLVPAVDGSMADSVAAIVVSVIIFISLMPLVQGLILTALSISALRKNKPSALLH